VKRLLILLALGLTLAAGEPGYQLFPGDLIRIEVYGHPDLLTEAHVPTSGELAFPLIGQLAGVNGRSPESLAAEIRTRLADGLIRDPSVQVQVREYGLRQIAVIGAVRNAGPVKLDPLRETSALQAIGAAGGFDEDADRAGAQVLRDDPTRPGGKLAITLPAGDLPETDVVLHNGDLVVVPRANRIFVLGQVQNARAVPMPNNEALTVSKAISLAGGFSRFAKEDKVQLLRRGVPPQSIDVKALLAGDGGSDPVLRAGDTIFVPESRF